MDTGVERTKELPVQEITTTTDTRNILGENAARLFNLDVKAKS